MKKKIRDYWMKKTKPPTMTPIQKAKELIELYVFNMPDGLTQGEHEVSIYHFLQTPAAAALLSGEDWKDDGGWIEIKEGNKFPDYDEYVLWLHEDGNMFVEALDKDGNPWIFGEEFQGFTYPKATHWQPLPKAPKP